MVWRREWKAIVAISVIVLVMVGAIVLKQSGPVEVEIAKIVGFGTYSDEMGGHPIVIVAAPDGRRDEVKTSPALLLGCSVGHAIRLLRKPHSLSVASNGCR